MTENEHVSPPTVTEARASVDAAKWLSYAILRLQVCVVSNNALPQYPPDLLRDDVRLVLEALEKMERATEALADANSELRAAWANNAKMKEEAEGMRAAIRQLDPILAAGDVYLVTGAALRRLMEGAGE